MGGQREKELQAGSIADPEVGLNHSTWRSEEECFRQKETKYKGLEVQMNLASQECKEDVIWALSVIHLLPQDVSPKIGTLVWAQIPS